MNRFFIIIFTLYLQYDTIAQSHNLVNNGSFENLKDCFDTCGKWFNYQPNLIAKNWTSATWGTPDIYSPCNFAISGNHICDSYYSPNNRYGYRTPKEGNNYAGLGVGAFNIGNLIPVPEGHEYITNQLKGELNNKVYCFSLSLSIASGYPPNNISKKNGYAFMAVSEFGLFFSTEKPFYNLNERKLNVTADLLFRSERDSFFRDTLHWEPLLMPYNAHGGELYITIGNLSSDYSGKYKLETNLSQSQRDSFRLSYALSYLYLDDISLVEIPELEAKADTNTIYKGNRAWLFSPTQAEEYTWFAGDTLNKIGSGDSLRVNPTETTTYYLKALQCKLTTYDTITITVLPAPLIPVHVSVVNTLTNSDFTIKFTGDNRPELQAELFNSVGQMVRSYTITETVNIGVSDLAAGIYYCRIRKDNVPVLTQKIVRVR